ncbi:MAG: hypothetical protein HRT36_02615 [Alphaproteobacteria bacterium]|nr:hypothetical protein [Alphaproteobacteria bacterium]
MNFTSISFIIDVIGSVLLVVVIFYTVRLNQHFQMLQKNRAELARQLSGFARSTERAEAAIQQVRQSTKESAQQVGELLQKGKMLKTDLGYLVDRANSLADRLEGVVRRERDQGSGRAASRSRRGGSHTATAATTMADSPPTKVERPAAEEPMARPTRRRRRSTNVEEDGSGGSASSNSELLKVLQGMR